MVFIRYFFIFWKLLFQSCVSVNDADKTRSGLQVIAAGEAYRCCIICKWKLKLKAQLQSFKVNEFVFLVLEKKIETLLNYYCRL